MHNNLQPSVFWQIAYKRQNSRRVCHFMAKTMSQKVTEEHCLNCGSYTDDSLLHSTLECRHAIPVHLRNDFWYALQTNFDVDTFNAISQLSKVDLLTLMLGRQALANVFKIDSEYSDFLLLSANFILKLAA